MLRKYKQKMKLVSQARKWAMPLMVALTLAMPRLVLAKPEPRVFKAGRYRLADGVLHRGQLCLVSDNELLIRGADTEQAKKYAAVDVQHFVIAADSFAVLHELDLLVNDVGTRYNHAMVQVCLAGNALKLYRFQGTMDVRILPNEMLARNILRGAAGGAVGIATGAVADKVSGAPSTGDFEEKNVVLLLLQRGTDPIATLQPKTKRALELLRATIADDVALTHSVRALSPLKLTDEAIQNVLTQYFARAITRQPKP